jgi:hypothetical protein
MGTLTDADYAWLKRIGISRERADFLAACPKLTKCGEKNRPADTFRERNPNHNLQRLAGHIYFRLRKDGKDIRVSLGSDLTAARKKRDELLADYEAHRHIILRQKS